MDGWVDGRKEPRWTSHLKATLNSRAVFGPANFNMLMFIKDYVCTDFWTKDFIPSVPHDNNNYQGLSLKTKAETLLLKTFWRRLRFWMIKNGSDSRWLLLRCRAEQGLKTHPINIFFGGIIHFVFQSIFWTARARDVDRKNTYLRVAESWRNNAANCFLSRANCGERRPSRYMDWYSECLSVVVWC